MNITYTNINGYFVPSLYSTDTAEIGRYGEMRRAYLQKHRPVLFDQLLLEGTLNRHLSEVDAAAHQAVADELAALAKAQGVTSDIKRTDPMAWVQQMNSLKAIAEEVVLPALLYPEEVGYLFPCLQNCLLKSVHLRLSMTLASIGFV